MVSPSPNGARETSGAVLHEAELRVVGVDVAGRLRRAFQVIASVGTAEELLLEGSLQDIAAYFQFYCARTRGAYCSGQKSDRCHSPNCRHISIVPPPAAPVRI